MDSNMLHRHSLVGQITALTTCLGTSDAREMIRAIDERVGGRG